MLPFQELNLASFQDRSADLCSIEGGYYFCEGPYTRGQYDWSTIIGLIHLDRPV